jgi:hypothetical protein
MVCHLVIDCVLFLTLTEAIYNCRNAHLSASTWLDQWMSGKGNVVPCFTTLWGKWDAKAAKSYASDMMRTLVHQQCNVLMVPAGMPFKPWNLIREKLTTAYNVQKVHISIQLRQLLYVCDC